LNVGKLLNRLQEYDAAQRHLNKALDTKEKIHGESSPQLVEVLTELGASTVHTKRASVAANHLIRAAGLSSLDENPAHEAAIHLRAGLTLVRLDRDNQAAPLLARAQSLFSAEFGELDVRGALAGMQLGRIHLDRGEFVDAKDVLEATVPAFAPPDMSEYALSSRKLLVEVYERLGQRDAATVHCVEYAKLKARDGSGFPERIFQGQPSSSNRFQSNRQAIGGASGRVIVQFIIDERGFVTDPEVMDSTEKRVEREAVDYVKAQRYAPKIVDGVPVKAYFRFSYGQSHRIRSY
ncbi:MAG: TonB family protein, partial [Pseudomonadota bacterium]